MFNILTICVLQTKTLLEKPAGGGYLSVYQYINIKALFEPLICPLFLG